MIRLTKTDHRDVSHSNAYDACMDLASISPYPSIGVIKFKLGTITITVMVLFLSKFFSEIIGLMTYSVPVLFAVSLSPTYMPYLVNRWRAAKDRLITEHRSQKLRLSYLRNFYDS